VYKKLKKRYVLLKVSKLDSNKILVLNPYNLDDVAQTFKSMAKEAISSVKDYQNWSQEELNKLYLAIIYLELHLLERYLILELPEEEAQRQCIEVTQFLLSSIYKEMFNVDIVPPNVLEYFSTYFSSNYKFISQSLILAPIPSKDSNEDLPPIFNNFCKCIEESGVAPFNVVKIVAQNIWNNWPNISSEKK